MHKRNDSGAVKWRRENALERWKANQDRGYLGRSFDSSKTGFPMRVVQSDSNYVDGQIQILERRLTSIHD